METFYGKKYPTSPLPPLVTTSVVADMIRFLKASIFSFKFDISRDCVREVATKKGFDTDSSMGKFVNKVAVHWDIRPKLEKREVILGASEVLEVINSFRTPFSIPLVRMEQVRLKFRI